MTRDERLMLAEQGAADPELMGADVHRPAGVSAAEAMREACADAIEPKNPPHDWTEYAKIRAQAAAIIRALPLPDDPRDAEIERLKTENLRLCEALMEIDTFALTPAYLVVSAWRHLGAISAKARAALAQPGVTP